MGQMGLMGLMGLMGGVGIRASALTLFQRGEGRVAMGWMAGLMGLMGRRGYFVKRLPFHL